MFKLLKRYFMVMCIVLAFCTSVSAANNQQPIDVVITQEMLLSMNDQARNNVLDAIKKTQKENIVSKDVQKELLSMDLKSFKEKLDTIADSLLIFFNKLGVSANEFIKTDLGILVILGIAYSIGIFTGVWSIFCSIGLIILCLVLMFIVNSKKKVILNRYDKDNKIINQQEVLIPKLNPFEDEENQSGFRLISSMVFLVGIIVAIVKLY